MAEKLPDVWETRDYPVLKEVVRRLDAGEQFVMAGDVAGAVGIAEADVAAAGRALKRRGLVAASGLKLRQVADQIGGLSRDVAAGVMTAVLTGSMGG
jgi:adenylosuccinate lyase